MEKRTRRSPARFLAPLALIAVVVALLAIISGSGGGGGTSTSESTTTTSSAQTSTSTTTSKQAKKKPAKSTDTGKTYTVQVGDTLGGIANKTGVPLQQIEALNPDVDPHAMTTGQEIRLK